MVKRGDAIDAARRQLEFVGNEEQQIVFEITEQLLRLVQHLDERIVTELMLLHVGFKDLEAFVAAGVFHDSSQTSLSIG